MTKCSNPTNDCNLVFCQKTGLCKKHFWSLPAKERIAMRQRWIPLFENYSVGDILNSEEYRQYSGRPVPIIPEYVIPKPPTKKKEVEPEITLPANTKRRLKIYYQYNGICWLCNKEVSRFDFSIDHVIPISKGGTSRIENLRPAHKLCNSIKSNYSINSSEEFYLHISRQSKIDRGFSSKKKKLLTEFEKAALAHKANSGTHPA